MRVGPRTGWIGIDIGTHSVKMAQVERNSGSVRLRRAAAIQRLEPWPAADRLPASSALPSLGQILAAAEYSRGLRGRRAACGLPMSVCEVRGLNIPAGDVRQRRAMIESELAEDWADRATSVEFDFWEVDVPRIAVNENPANVHVVAAPRPWIDQMADDCRSARLDCWAVDAAPMALGRAAALANQGGTPQPVLAIDWGFRSATLVVAARGQPLYTRALRDSQLSHVITAVESQLGVSRDEAQHLLFTYGLITAADEHQPDTELQAAITEAAENTLDALTREVDRTIQFLSTSRAAWLPDAVVLAGGGACIANVEGHLQTRLEMPVAAWRLPGSSPNGTTDGTSVALFAQAAALSALAWGER